MKTLQRLLAAIAVLFGIATIVAGARVLLGADPGYPVHRSLLAYNTIMGLAYIGAGLLAWADLRRGRYAAASIFILNCSVLGIVWYLYLHDSGVAIESVRAMALRTVVWLGLLLGLLRLSARKRDDNTR